MRSKSGVVSHRKRVKVRRANKGKQHTVRTSYKMGKQSVVRSLQYAYRDRRNKKRDFRRLWIQRINAAARQNGTTYSKLITDMKKANINLDRKVLAQIAYEDPKAFAAVVEAAKTPAKTKSS